MLPLLFAAALAVQEGDERPRLDVDQLRAATRLVGLDFSDAELELMLGTVRRKVGGFRALREGGIDNSVVPALTFSPLLPGIELRVPEPPEPYPPRASVDVAHLADLAPDQLAFEGIEALGTRIARREITCVELTEMYLERLERLDRELKCVVSFTRERALAQARQLDAELAEGKRRGPLHGIPWGAKDLFAVKGTRTTWGAKPYEEQEIDLDATVVRRLDEAGAVLVAKLSLGALAMGDVWFGGTTKNPWDPRQGSSGSSAGSASAVAAGGVAFALGTETLGSIVSPAARCGVSALRPTFGRVSRHGAMALSWSMDKVGPICRSADDVEIVLRAIAGPDGLDPSVHDVPLHPAHAYAVAGLRVGIPRGAFERAEELAHVLEELEGLGVSLVEVDLPDFPTEAMMIVLDAEAATAFDELTRSDRDDLLVRQDGGAWPNSFRSARLIPAVEYLRAQRLRTELMLAMDRALAEVDALVHPNFAAGVLRITNLTGHPTAIVPCGRSDGGTPPTISFTGQLFDEGRLLALVQAYQAATDHERQRPALDFLEAAPGEEGKDR